MVKKAAEARKKEIQNINGRSGPNKLTDLEYEKIKQERIGPQS